MRLLTIELTTIPKKLDFSPFKKNNKLYWSAILVDTINPNTNFKQLVVLELDTNYHHIALHKVNAQSYSAKNLSNLIYIQNRYYLSEWDLFSGVSKIYKLDEQFVKLDSVTYNTDLSEMRASDNKLVLNVSNFPSPCQGPLGGWAEKLILDTNFNIINCFTFSALDNIQLNNIGNSVSIEHIYSRILPLSKTKTLCIGNGHFSYSIGSSKFGIVNCLIDHNNTILKASVYSSSITNISYILGSNIVAAKQNEILSVGCIGYNFQYPSNLQPQKTKMLVTKIDTLGNLYPSDEVHLT